MLGGGREGILSTQACTNEWLGLVDGKDLLIRGISTERPPLPILFFLSPSLSLFLFERGKINCACTSEA